MADTFLISKEIPIKRQEGDTASIRITIPDIIAIAEFDIRFHVYMRNGNLVFKKESGEWSVDGQVVSTTLAPNDTKGKVGIHLWEMEITHKSGDPERVHTIGRGPFTIIKEYIK